jgi:hypothetical protein
MISAERTDHFITLGQSASSAKILFHTKADLDCYIFASCRMSHAARLAPRPDAAGRARCQYLNFLADLPNEAKPSAPSRAPSGASRPVINATPEPPSPSRIPPPAPEKPEVPRDQDMFAFSIVAKLLLPTNTVERIDLIFNKLLEAKVSFQSVSMSISRTVERCPPVLLCW